MVCKAFANKSGNNSIAFGNLQVNLAWYSANNSSFIIKLSRLIQVTLFKKKREDYFKLAKLDPYYKVFFSENESALLTADEEKNAALFETFEKGGADNIATAVGHNFQENPFHLNTPTVLNSALYFKEFWDGRVRDVEEQASGPLLSSFEMNMSKEEIILRDYLQRYENLKIKTQNCIDYLNKNNHKNGNMKRQVLKAENSIGIMDIRVQNAHLLLK